MRTRFPIALLSGLLVVVPTAVSGASGPLPAQLAQAPDRGVAYAQAPAASTMAEGQVRKIDKAAGKITLRHGPVENLGMPPMTMVFRVVDPAVLEQLAPGDRVRFSAEESKGVYTVTRIEKQ